MKFLLDTHIWLWSLIDPGRLAPKVAREIEHPENELWLSPISVWEFLVLVEKKRLAVDREPEAWLRQVFDRAPLIEAPVNTEVAIATRDIGLPHRDPADRFIAATARVFGLMLVTADERMFAPKGVRVLKNKG
ncbi:MAG: type II toxin-antitoxin system VapC family toxin [Deltaproteobacteria bacterium]|nr:type II toxin-antitoxin system VapC family toxin [Deltaproteobacteria bacterium]